MASCSRFVCGRDATVVHCCRARDTSSMHYASFSQYLERNFIPGLKLEPEPI
ncbi:hypothetical protein PIIN_10122 [Serendipita indica DSM 11827]|uniref:Uncharacterized protein n=1 Tax=Serendipita indica (strain DSM 11827) TaxID=1109443 RepID=G4TXS9_SERID|nr:hypothetical protein PIIN_10122 [Serendipita indica DSM 11827]